MIVFVRLGRASPPKASFGIFEPEAFAIGFDDMDSMGEPVEQRVGETFAPQDLSPCFKSREVGQRISV